MSRIRFLSLLTLASAVLTPQVAHACGGCVSPPPVPGQPVVDTIVQDAERVLFVKDPATKTSHVWVEVRYSGLAKDFGWVLPVPKVPKVGVGTVRLFDALDTALRARYHLQYLLDENCRNAQEGCEPYYPDAAAYDAKESADVTSDGAMANGPGGVEVLSSGTTGPYDYVVIKGSDATGLTDWLNSHGYVLPEKAKPIVQSHIQAGDVFVAIKLSNGQGVNAIRPVTLEMPEDAEPCVPLRLTSIAAAEEMKVVVTIAGPGRAVVKNHLDVTVNPFRLKLVDAPGSYVPDQEPANYQQVLSAAIDEAGGRAFVTEASDGLGNLSPYSPASQWQAWKTKLQTVQTLADLGYLVAFLGIPVDDETADAIALPAHLTELDATLPPVQILAKLRSCQIYWNQGGLTSCQLPDGSVLDEAQVLAVAVDGNAVAKALDAAIYGPLGDTWGLLAAQPRTTRLAMRISPQEMDRDPVFSFNPTLPKVQPLRTLQANLVCTQGWNNKELATRLSLDGLGSWVFLGNNAADARFVKAPAALTMQLLDESGPALDIAATQADLVSTAIAGAKPGKPSLPTDLVLQTAAPWLPPPSDAIVTKLTPWQKPWSYCTPKKGWTDGQMPPNDAPAESDAGSTTDSSPGKDSAGKDSAGTVPGIDAAGGWSDAEVQDASVAVPPATRTASSSCNSSPAQGNPWSAWLALGTVLGMLLMRRRLSPR